MVDNQFFNSRTNFLKNEKNINFSVQAAKLRVERHVFDSWRANRVTVPEHFENRLVTEFPELADYRTATEDVLRDSQEQAGYGEAGILRETLEVQKELIAMQRLRIAQLEIENEKLKSKL
jgi:hypothetical protein